MGASDDDLIQSLTEDVTHAKGQRPATIYERLIPAGSQAAALTKRRWPL